MWSHMINDGVCEKWLDNNIPYQRWCHKNFPQQTIFRNGVKGKSKSTSRQYKLVWLSLPWSSWWLHFFRFALVIGLQWRRPQRHQFPCYTRLQKHLLLFFMYCWLRQELFTLRCAWGRQGHSYDFHEPNPTAVPLKCFNNRVPIHQWRSIPMPLDVLAIIIVVAVVILLQLVCQCNKDNRKI